MAKTNMSQRQIQAQLDEASFADLEILGKYQGKEIIFEEDHTYGGVLNEFGQEFVHITYLKGYDLPFDSIWTGFKALDTFTYFPPQTFRRSKIERIVLIEDVIKYRELKKSK